MQCSERFGHFGASPQTSEEGVMPMATPLRVRFSQAFLSGYTSSQQEVYRHWRGILIGRRNSLLLVRWDWQGPADAPFVYYRNRLVMAVD